MIEKRGYTRTDQGASKQVQENKNSSVRYTHSLMHQTRQKLNRGFVYFKVERIKRTLISPKSGHNSTRMRRKLLRDQLTLAEPPTEEVALKVPTTVTNHNSLFTHVTSKKARLN